MSILIGTSLAIATAPTILVIRRFVQERHRRRWLKTMRALINLPSHVLRQPQASVTILDAQVIERPSSLFTEHDSAA